MINVSIKSGFNSKSGRALLFSAGDKLVREAAATALTRTAAHAAFALRKEMPDIFDRPTPFTRNAIFYTPATPGSLRASVFIGYEAAKGVPPSKYLSAEILGGPRRDKSSERQLKAKAMMNAGQQLVPGSGAPLNAFGNIPGSAMVRLLSRIGAFGEQGYNANASDAMKRMLAKAHSAVRRSGTNFFLAHSKRDGEPLAIYQLVSKGKVKPVLWFVDRRPNYSARFPFTAEVGHFVAAVWPKEMRRALLERIARFAHGQ